MFQHQGRKNRNTELNLAEKTALKSRVALRIDGLTLLSLKLTSSTSKSFIFLFLDLQNCNYSKMLFIAY